MTGSPRISSTSYWVNNAVALTHRAMPRPMSMNINDWCYTKNYAPFFAGISGTQLTPAMPNNSTESPSKSDAKFQVDYHTALITCSLMICITNCFVITLFLTQASLRSIGNHLLFSLAILDLAVGLFGIPVNFACEMTQRCDVCLVAYSVNRFIAISTVYHILWITLEKYNAIIHPFRHRSRFDEKTVKCICLGTWFGSLLVSVVELISLTRHHNGSCGNYARKKEIIYHIFVFAGAFVFPMAIMIFAYSSIFLRILRRHSKEFFSKHMTDGRESARSMHTRIPRVIKSALLFFVILLVFVLGWFWWFFVAIYYNIFENKKQLVSQNVARILTVLRYSTSFLNPILYTFFKGDFNKALRRVANCSRLGPLH